MYGDRNYVFVIFVNNFIFRVFCFVSVIEWFFGVVIIGIDMVVVSICVIFIDI